jgi:tetratricopeptide (TPR) repeat protein
VTELHPAIVLILEAEGTPTFQHAAAKVLDLLAAATAQDPEALPSEWVVRLALRMAEVLVVRREELGRARLWLEQAERHLGSDDAALQWRLGVLRARALGWSGALDEASQALDALPSAPAPWCAAQRDVARAELCFMRTAWGPVEGLLAPHLQTHDAFQSLDDLWRAMRLLASARRNRLDLEGAEPLWRAVAQTCEVHGAALDEADARIALGQCLLGLGRTDEGVAQLELALERAKADPKVWQQVAANLTTALMAAGDLEAALSQTQRAAQRAAQDDDAHTYMMCLSAGVALYRLARRHKDAYRELLAVYGELLGKFGPDAAAKVLPLIEGLRADLGDEAFEALSSELLAERQQ